MVPVAFRSIPCRLPPRSAACSVPVTKRSPLAEIVRTAPAPLVVTSPEMTADPGALTSPARAAASTVVASAGACGTDGGVACGVGSNVMSPVAGKWTVPPGWPWPPGDVAAPPATFSSGAVVTTDASGLPDDEPPPHPIPPASSSIARLATAAPHIPLRCIALPKCNRGARPGTAADPQSTSAAVTISCTVAAPISPRRNANRSAEVAQVSPAARAPGAVRRLLTLDAQLDVRHQLQPLVGDRLLAF